MSLSECYFAHAGKCGKPVDRVPAGESLPTTEVEAASNHRVDVYEPRSCTQTQQHAAESTNQHVRETQVHRSAFTMRCETALCSRQSSAAGFDCGPLVVFAPSRRGAAVGYRAPVGPRRRRRQLVVTTVISAID